MAVRAPQKMLLQPCSWPASGTQRTATVAAERIISPSWWPDGSLQGPSARPRCCPRSRARLALPSPRAVPLLIRYQSCRHLAANLHHLTVLSQFLSAELPRLAPSLIRKRPAPKRTKRLGLLQ
uniref:(California timema) hypothetical protein n=1 Tax=Timema californicum TaxID=61474 RepID=A0A7R9JL15_TIMCA|nr:unnamed protein product [Timema californicum]